MKTTKNQTISKLLGVAVIISVWAGTSSANLVVLQENFDGGDNFNTQKPPTNTVNVGTWLTPTDLEVTSDAFVSSPFGARFWSDDGGYQANPGYIQSIQKADIPGTPVHAELQLRYWQGLDIAFGITADTAAMASSGANSNALLWLQFQGQSGSFPHLNSLQTMNSSGTLVDVGDGTVDLVELEWKKIEFDYYVGDTTGILKINGVVVDSSVALRNPGGAVDGMFFLDDKQTASNSRYYIDDLLITIPEPTSVALMGAGGLLMLWRRGKRRSR